MSFEGVVDGGSQTNGRMEIETQAGCGLIELTLADVRNCNLSEMSKDKFKSRQLQRSLTHGGQEQRELIITKAQPHLMELVKDQNGNYLFQKILEVVNAVQFDTYFDLLKGDLIALAKDTYGTRAVQKLVEQAINRLQVEQLLSALPAEQAAELARNVTGFHVIVKLLDSLAIEKTAPLLSQLCGTPADVLALAEDQWGCCVLKKCVDRSEKDMKDKIVDAIVQNAVDLVQDAFGNYVVQHFIVTGQHNTIARIVDALKGHVRELALQKFSSNVLEKCIKNGTDKDRNKIINEILNPPDVQEASEAIENLLFHQFGNYVFQQSMEVAKEPQYALLIEHCKPHIQELYVEHLKQQALGTCGPVHTDSPLPGGCLSAEHSQRLAVKLSKKHPALLEGLDFTSLGLMGIDASWMLGCDPLAMAMADPAFYGMNGYDPYACPYPTMAMDYAYGYGWQQPQPQKGKGKGRKKGDGKGKGKGKGKSNGAAQDGAVAGDFDDTIKVGRITGFWPNYEIVYDDVKNPYGEKQTRGGKKNKAKGKTANMITEEVETAA